MQTKTQNWGNSLGVRVPRDLAEEVGLKAAPMSVTPRRIVNWS